MKFPPPALVNLDEGKFVLMEGRRERDLQVGRENRDVISLELFFCFFREE